jgi:hypothetical protein
VSDNPKKPVPGGRSVVGAKPYCDAWRKYAEPVAEFMGWHIHSFGKDIKFVSPDYKHTQVMGIPFIEDLYKAIQKANKYKTRPAPVSSSSAPSSSAAYPTPPRSRVSPRSSTAPSTWTFDTKTDSSKPDP